MFITEKRDNLSAKLTGYQTRLKAGEVLTDDEIAEVQNTINELEEVDKQIKVAKKSEALLAGIGGIGTEHKEDGTGDAKARTLGDNFMKAVEASGQELKSGARIQAPEFKAPILVSDEAQHLEPLVTDVDTRGVQFPQRELAVADLFSQGTVDGNAIKYPVWGKPTGAGFVVTEGGEKPLFSYGITKWETDSLAEIAGLFEISDLMAEDAAYVVSSINNALRYTLDLNEENSLVSGTGESGTIKGVLNREGVLVATTTAANLADEILHQIGQVQEESGLPADGIIINPADYFALRTAKDANGQYFAGGPFTGAYGNGNVRQFLPIWTTPTVVTSAIAKGTVLVGAFKRGGTVLRKGGIIVDTTNAHKDNFAHDILAIRARKRVGLQVTHPSAFAKITVEG